MQHGEEGSVLAWTFLWGGMCKGRSSRGRNPLEPRDRLDKVKASGVGQYKKTAVWIESVASEGA